MLIIFAQNTINDEFLENALIFKIGIFSNKIHFDLCCYYFDCIRRWYVYNWRHIFLFV